MNEGPQQLDIFAHSRDVMLRNDTLQALQQRDAGRAHAAIGALAAEAAADPLLPALRRLAHALEGIDEAPFADHDALAAARQHLESELATAARSAFGDLGAATWLRPLRRALARRAASMPFVAARADDHPAPLWLQAQDWAAAAAAVQRFDREFDGAGDDEDLAWFPAWLANAQPALAPRLAAAGPGRHDAPERAFRLMIELLGQEHQGRHQALMQRRQALRDLHRGLFGAYMATR
jgi:hypothetical protein